MARTKKGFKNAEGAKAITEQENPAESFITTTSQPEQAAPKKRRRPKLDATTDAPKAKRGRKPKQQPEQAAAAQTETREPSPSTGRTVTITLREGESLNTAVIEAKKKRVQLVFRPSLYDRLKAESDRRGVSVNECIHQILEISLP